MSVTKETEITPDDASVAFSVSGCSEISKESKESDCFVFEMDNASVMSDEPTQKTTSFFRNTIQNIEWTPCTLILILNFFMYLYIFAYHTEQTLMAAVFTASNSFMVVGCWGTKKDFDLFTIFSSFYISVLSASYNVVF